MLPPPMPALPLDDPLRDPIEYVLGVGRDLHLAGLFEGQQALNRRHQFHPVVGGVRIESERLLLYVTEPKYAGPPAWAGITETRAIGDPSDFLRSPGLAVAVPPHLLNIFPLPARDSTLPLVRPSRARRTVLIT